MRTGPGISQFLYPLEETVRNKFIPLITGGHICSNNERQLLPLPTRYGGLAIPKFYGLAETEFENSRKIMSELTPLGSIHKVRMQLVGEEGSIKSVQVRTKGGGVSKASSTYAVRLCIRTQGEGGK